MALAKPFDLEHKLSRNHVSEAGLLGLNVHASLGGVAHCALGGDNNVGLCLEAHPEMHNIVSALRVWGVLGYRVLGFRLGCRI
jgi:hypothetical protein